MKKSSAFLLSTVVLLLAAALGFWASIAFHRLKTPERTFHYPTTFVATLKNDPQAGQKIYREYCAACHAPHPRIELNAPRFGNKKDWQPYAKLSMQTLLTITAHGVGAMPARGGCFECDDALLQQAIDYLLARF